jgi:hypothetical protein
VVDAYEISVRRIGGKSEKEFPSSWSWVTPLHFIGLESQSLQPWNGPASWCDIYVEFSGWSEGPAEHWKAGIVRLTLPGGQRIGDRRPVLVYTKPCDVAAYVTVVDQYDGEIYVIGVRRYSPKETSK